MFVSKLAGYVIKTDSKPARAKKLNRMVTLSENIISWYLPTVSQSVMLCFNFRSIPSELFLRIGVLKLCSKLTREHSCRSAISIIS